MSPAPCPCGSRISYATCCEPLHLRAAFAQTAEQLMRSRYSAFCQGKIDYLIATLHPSRRRPTDRESLTQTISSTQWLRLQILATEGGQSTDNTGQVEFVATYTEAATPHRLHERSHFVHESQRWFYLHGEVENLRPLPKPGRNAPCWCGSGKKSKRCHG